MKGWPASLRPSALQWVAFLGIVYFALVAQAFHVIEPCGGTGGFLAALGCLEANELGDLLAGIFAPLAFLGLGFAIYIQSQELRAQREELAATREEMRASRSVSEANVGFVAAQARTAELTVEKILEDRAVVRFEAAGRTLARMLAITFETHMVISWPSAEGGAKATHIRGEFPTLGGDTERYLREMTVALTKMKNQFSDITVAAVGQSSLQENFQYFRAIEDSIRLMGRTSNEFWDETRLIYPSVDFNVLAQRIIEIRDIFKVVDLAVG